MRKTIFLPLFLCFFWANTSLTAQTADAPWSIGVSLGKAAYNGDIGNGFFNFDQAFHGFVGLNVNRYMSNWVDLSLNGTYGRHGYMEYNENFLTMLTQMNLAVNLKMNNGVLLSEDAKFAPYFFTGLGFVNYTPVEDRGTKGTDFSVPLGVGANYAVSDKVSIFWQSSYNFTGGDDSDNMMGDANTSNMVRGNDAIMLHQVGVKFNLGKKAVDTDGDGIADKKDACPMTAGVATFGGCPDTDGDGIMDKEDQCPSVKGTLAFNGCPDTDGDGIADAKDDCPNVKGTKAMKGCPDRDNDGVSDKNDRCPNVKGVASNNGCPEISESTRSIFREALTGIHFETAKAVIKPSSYAILDKVVRVMKDNPSYQLSIEGHTDSQGNDASNMTLSEKRATSVMNYLTRKGVKASRMTARGYGETKPVASNDTKQGRAQNRRVEFSVTF